MLDLELLFHGVKARVRGGGVHVAARGLYAVAGGQRVARLAFEETGIRPAMPEPRFWSKGIALIGYGERAAILRRYGGSAGEIRGPYFHGVVEVQDRFIKSQVRRAVKGL